MQTVGDYSNLEPRLLEPRPIELRDRNRPQDCETIGSRPAKMIS